MNLIMSIDSILLTVLVIAVALTIWLGRQADVVVAQVNERNRQSD